MKNILLDKIDPKDLDKLSISLFGYVAPNKTNQKTKIYAAQVRAFSSFYNTKDFKVKSFMKYPSTLLTNKFFEELKTNHEKI